MEHIDLLGWLYKKSKVTVVGKGSCGHSHPARHSNWLDILSWLPFIQIPWAHACPNTKSEASEFSTEMNGVSTHYVCINTLCS